MSVLIRILRLLFNVLVRKDTFHSHSVQYDDVNLRNVDIEPLYDIISHARLKLQYTEDMLDFESRACKFDLMQDEAKIFAKNATRLHELRQRTNLHKYTVIGCNEVYSDNIWHRRAVTINTLRLPDTDDCHTPRTTEDLYARNDLKLAGSF